MWSKRIIHGQYEVIKPYQEDDKKFIGLCLRLKDQVRVVIKATENAAELRHESEMNKLLGENSPEVTKMLEYVPAESGTGYLKLSFGYSISCFSYMVLPVMGPDLVEVIMQANKEDIQLSWDTKQYLCS
jgi:hypothetical protein